MKSISFSAIVLVVLLIFNGEMMMRSVEGEGLCEKALHGGGCKDAECMSGCKAQFGATAIGLCFFFRTPSDTCLCRYPC
ncbi:unnamed protein product [Citrullus colocynthis]|uniref:Defensin-like protein n=1 Tax=Citrullus colocynthis TaxID=252529 RepID=A0ABP0Z4X3_9ROSI